MALTYEKPTMEVFPVNPQDVVRCDSGEEDWENTCSGLNRNDLLGKYGEWYEVEHREINGEDFVACTTRNPRYNEDHPEQHLPLWFPWHPDNN